MKILSNALINLNYFVIEMYNKMTDKISDDELIHRAIYNNKVHTVNKSINELLEFADKEIELDHIKDCLERVLYVIQLEKAMKDKTKMIDMTKLPEWLKLETR